MFWIKTQRRLIPELGVYNLYTVQALYSISHQDLCQSHYGAMLSDYCTGIKRSNPVGRVNRVGVRKLTMTVYHDQHY